MKIRLRLTLWYFLITLTIVIVLNLGTYLGMKRLVYRAIDEELLFVAESMERSYDPFFNEFENLYNFPGTANPYLQYYMVVYNQAKKPVFISPMARLINLEIPPGDDGNTGGFTKEVKLSEDNPVLRPEVNEGITFRVVSRRLFYKNNTVGWITVALPFERIDQSMSNLLYLLGIGGGIIMILIGIGGYFLTRQTLQPVNIITRKASRISQSSLDERIQVQNKDDELGQLSIVLNNLLERLQKAFDSQQHFLADAAHELKTPLSILRAHWESELNNPEVSLEMKEKLVQDVETITRLNHMISNLMLLSQTESIQSNFEFEQLRLDELLQEVINDAMIIAESKSQQLEICDMPSVELRGDKIRLYQLLMNIVDNALKYTPENGKVEVSLQVSGRWAQIQIRDDGPGIPGEDLPHIFERFYRVQKDRARKTGGSGLGLSICKLIAESHDGSIEVESVVGKGTTFFIRLPISLM